MNTPPRSCELPGAGPRLLGVLTVHQRKPPVRSLSQRAEHLTAQEAMLLDEATLILGPHALDGVIRDHFRQRPIPRRRQSLLTKLYRLHHLAVDDVPDMSRPGDVTAAIGRVALADGQPCFYCGSPAQVIDHIWPRVHGGDDQPRNLRPACSSCNLRKGQRSIFGMACPLCGATRHPGDFNTSTFNAYYHCRCGATWTRLWEHDDLRL